jgi:formylglycine-generating enzyme required for sulfatase activity
VAAGLQVAWAKKLGIPVEFTNDVKMKFRLIPPGEFTMGSSRVTLSRPFYFGVYEVTYEQFQAVNRLYRVDKALPAAPAIGVTWQMAYNYCDSLAQRPPERKAKRDYRLPTEAEWEYACRAGTETPYWWGRTATDEQLNANERVGNVKPVGSYAANPFGLFDVHGNATEW